MRNCFAIGVRYLVVHTGSHPGQGNWIALENVRSSIGAALDSERSTELLLENLSGYRNSSGSDFRGIGAMIDMIGRPRVGICLDTRHAYAYDIANAKGTLGRWA